MELLPFSVTFPNGEALELRVSETGEFVCPVCGCFLPTPPYHPDSFAASREFCPSCETQFGWDDFVSPDAPPGSQADKWRELREKWLAETARNDEARAQLEHLGLEMPAE